MYGRLCTSGNLYSFCQFKVFLLQQFLLQGTGSTFLDDLVLYHFFFQSADVAGLCQLSEARQVRIDRLVCLLGSQPEFVPFSHHVPFWGKVSTQGGLHNIKGLVVIREHMKNALLCTAMAMQHHGSLNRIILLCQVGSNGVNFKGTQPVFPFTVLPVPRLRGRLGQVRCRKASWGCFGGRSFQNGGRKHESSAS